METAIVVAIITGAFSVLGTWVLTRSEAKKANHKAEVKEAEEKTRLEDRLASIESKLDEHNGYGAKFVEMAGKYNDIEKLLVAMGKDIEYLRKGA